MEIIQAPNPVLSKIAKPINKIDKEILQIIEDMKKTLLQTSDPKGIGLAAPQVGISLQLFIIKEEDNSPFSIFINPKITLINSKIKKSEIQVPIQSGQEVSSENSITDSLETIKKKKRRKERLEGCLSLKDIWGQVYRAPNVEIKYTTIDNQTKTENFNGFFATIIQHEYDHLQGILFPKRTLEQNGKLYKSVKDGKGEEVFEEINI